MPDLEITDKAVKTEDCGHLASPSSAVNAIYIINKKSQASIGNKRTDINQKPSILQAINIPTNPRMCSK